MDMMNAAFKFVQALDERLDRIEVLLGRLVDAKDDREKAKELGALVRAKADALGKAIPAGTSEQ